MYMKGESEFSTYGHLQAVKEESSDVRKSQDDINDAKLELISKNLDVLDCRLFLCAKQTGFWMTVQSNTVTGTVLLAMEF